MTGQVINWLITEIWWIFFQGLKMKKIILKNWRAKKTTHKNNSIYIYTLDTGHLAKDCSATQEQISCYNCKQVGHLVKNCPTKTDDRPCYVCNKPGHLSRNCTETGEFLALKSPIQSANRLKLIFKFKVTFSWNTFSSKWNSRLV